MIKNFQIMVVAFVVVFFTACKSNTQNPVNEPVNAPTDSLTQKSDSQHQNKPYLPAELQESPERKLTAEIYKNPDNTFGYAVRMGGKKIIDQPMIPARQGTRGFVSPEEAQAVADLVIAKIREGQVPPAISETELDSMGIR